MTPRQRAFAHEYAKDHNGLQAVLRAGFSVKGASVTAVRLIAIPSVKAIIDDLDKKAMAAASMTAADLRKRMADIVNSSDKDRVAAANLLAKLSPGWLAPIKTETVIMSEDERKARLQALLDEAKAK